MSRRKYIGNIKYKEINGYLIVGSQNNTSEFNNWLPLTTNVVASNNTNYLVSNTNVDPIQVIIPTGSPIGYNFTILSVNGTFQITQNASQQIRFGNITTTEGVNGKIVSADNGDCIRVVCVDTPNLWAVFSIVGNLVFY
jgi:hypothetical protein